MCAHLQYKVLCHFLEKKQVFQKKSNICLEDSYPFYNYTIIPTRFFQQVRFTGLVVFFLDTKRRSRYHHCNHAE